MALAAYVNKQICFISLDSNVQNSLYSTLPNRQGELDLQKMIEEFNSLVTLDVRRSYYLDPKALHPLVMPFILPREYFHNEPLIIYHRDHVISAESLEDGMDQ